MENTKYADQSGCNYISAATNFEPSCSEDSLVSITSTCSCAMCFSRYRVSFEDMRSSVVVPNNLHLYSVL
jgi:hypothetical protein